MQRLCVVCNSFAFCNSVSADRSGMAASSFIAAAGACVILLRFAAESHKLHHVIAAWKLRMVLWQPFFFILVLMIFLYKFLLKSA